MQSISPTIIASIRAAAATTLSVRLSPPVNALTATQPVNTGSPPALSPQQADHLLRDAFATLLGRNATPSQASTATLSAASNTAASSVAAQLRVGDVSVVLSTLAQSISQAIGNPAATERLLEAAGRLALLIQRSAHKAMATSTESEEARALTPARDSSLPPVMHSPLQPSATLQKRLRTRKTQGSETEEEDAALDSEEEEALADLFERLGISTQPKTQNGPDQSGLISIKEWLGKNQDRGYESLASSEFAAGAVASSSTIDEDA